VSDDHKGFSSSELKAENRRLQESLDQCRKMMAECRSRLADKGEESFLPRVRGPRPTR
jgi:hypothetical protein